MGHLVFQSCVDLLGELNAIDVQLDTVRYKFDLRDGERNCVFNLSSFVPVVIIQ